MPNATTILLIPFLPLAGFLLMGLFGRKYLGKSSGLIGTAFMLTSTILALYTAYEYFFVYGKTYDEIISGYRLLTGKAPLVPKRIMLSLR